jgi:hypothetical protein
VALLDSTGFAVETEGPVDRGRFGIRDGGFAHVQGAAAGRLETGSSALLFSLGCQV